MAYESLVHREVAGRRNLFRASREQRQMPASKRRTMDTTPTVSGREARDVSFYFDIFFFFWRLLLYTHVQVRRGGGAHTGDASDCASRKPRLAGR